jgi:hypothetical protein
MKIRRKQFREDREDDGKKKRERGLSFLGPEEENRQPQTKAINARHPKPGNWPYDAKSIGTDQTRNVDAHPDPDQQTDGEFPEHARRGMS